MFPFLYYIYLDAVITTEIQRRQNLVRNQTVDNHSCKRILQPARIIPAILHRGKPSHFSFFEYFLLWRGCPYVQNFPLFSWKSLAQDLEFASLQLSSFRLTHMTPLFATVTLPLCLSQLGILLP